MGFRHHGEKDAECSLPPLPGNENEQNTGTGYLEASLT